MFRKTCLGIEYYGELIWSIAKRPFENLLGEQSLRSRIGEAAAGESSVKLGGEERGTEHEREPDSQDNSGSAKSCCSDHFHIVTPGFILDSPSGIIRVVSDCANCNGGRIRVPDSFVDRARFSWLTGWLIRTSNTDVMSSSR